VIHKPLRMGLTYVPVCGDCGIPLPANYGCPDCTWEGVLHVEGQVLEICTRLCEQHKFNL